MAFKGLLFGLLFVPVFAQMSINATVGGSAEIKCSLRLSSHPVEFWFYWQEDGTKNILYFWDKGKEGQSAERYRERCQALNKMEFSSGNISIKLNNVTIGDDKKTIWANAIFTDEHGKHNEFTKECKSTLLVEAPYQGPDLTINGTNTATCTAYGGYPAAQVSWTGRDKSSNAILDLQSTENDTTRDPVHKTYNVTSTVSIKNLKSVTCYIYNPRSPERRNKTEEIDARTGQEDLPGWAIALIAAAAVIIAAAVTGAMGYYVYKKRAGQYSVTDTNRPNRNEICMSTFNAQTPNSAALAPNEDPAVEAAGEQDTFLNNDGN